MHQVVDELEDFEHNYLPSTGTSPSVARYKKAMADAEERPFLLDLHYGRPSNCTCDNPSNLRGQESFSQQLGQRNLLESVLAMHLQRVEGSDLKLDPASLGDLTLTCDQV